MWKMRESHILTLSNSGSETGQNSRTVETFQMSGRAVESPPQASLENISLTCEDPLSAARRFQLTSSPCAQNLLGPFYLIITRPCISVPRLLTSRIFMFLSFSVPMCAVSLVLVYLRRGEQPSEGRAEVIHMPRKTKQTSKTLNSGHGNSYVGAAYTYIGIEIALGMGNSDADPNARGAAPPRPTARLGASRTN